MIRLSVFACMPFSCSYAAQHINFSEAASLALSASPRINASAAGIEEAGASIIEARGNGLPSLSIQVNAARSDNPLNVFGYKLSQGSASFADFGFAQFTGPQSINTMPTALDAPGYYSNYNTGIVMQIPIFSGGRNMAELKRNEFLLLAARHGDQQARSELVYNVLKAYEGVRAADAVILVARQELKAARAFLKMTRLLSGQSLVIQSDIMLAETFSRSADAALKTAIVERNNQLDAFRILIGKPDSDLVPGESVRLLPPGKSPDGLKYTMMRSNSQLLSLKSRTSAYREGIQSADSRQWPQVNLQLRHDWNANTLALSGSSNTAMIELNWELFSSGAQSGASQRAAAQYRHSLAEYENESDNLRFTLQQTVRAIETARIQLDLSGQNARELESVVSEMKKRYGQGVANLGQLLDSQSRLDSARIQRAMAQYGLLLARARLLMLVNELRPDSLGRHRCDGKGCGAGNSSVWKYDL